MQLRGVIMKPEKVMTYAKALQLLKDAKAWVLEGDDIFVPQFLLSKGLPSTTFDAIRGKYPELAPKIDEVLHLDEAKIVGFMAKGTISKNVGEFILNRYYTPRGDTSSAEGVAVHLEY